MRKVLIVALGFVSLGAFSQSALAVDDACMQNYRGCIRGAIDKYIGTVAEHRNALETCTAIWVHCTGILGDKTATHGAAGQQSNGGAGNLKDIPGANSGTTAGPNPGSNTHAVGVGASAGAMSTIPGAATATTNAGAISGGTGGAVVNSTPGGGAVTNSGVIAGANKRAGGGPVGGAGATRFRAQ